MATVSRLIEQFEFSGTVADNSNVIKDVPLCGPKSRHKRRYLRKAFEGNRVELYNGRPVYLNHVKGTEPRIYQDSIGVIENAHHHPTTGMPFGDIKVNPEKPYAKAVLWDAKNNPRACSMSHIADCASVRCADGWDDITELVYVESVDLVTTGATTSSMREGANRAMSKTYTIKQLAEWVQRNPKSTSPAIVGIKRLAEDDAMGGLPVMDAPPADDAEPMDKIWDALKSVIADKIEECKESGDNINDCVKAIKDLVKGYHGMAGKKPADDKPGDAKKDDEPPKDDKAEAALRSATAITESLKVCKEAGYRPDADDLEDLASLPAPRRKGHIEKLKKLQEGTGREQPRSTPRQPGSGTPAPANGNGEPPVNDAKKFKEWVTSD